MRKIKLLKAFDMLAIIFNASEIIAEMNLKYIYIFENNID